MNPANERAAAPETRLEVFDSFGREDECGLDEEPCWEAEERREAD